MSNSVVGITDYKYGFSKPENYVFKSKRGLDVGVVEEISAMKSEPQWMRDLRIKALGIFEKKKMPSWGADLSTIDFDNIFYYIKPTDNQKTDWRDLPKEIKDTYDLFIILKNKYFTLSQLIKGVERKFGEQIDPANLLARLSNSLKNFDGLKLLSVNKNYTKKQISDFMQDQFNHFLDNNNF